MSLKSILKRATRPLLNIIRRFNRTHFEEPASNPAARNTPLKSQPAPVRHEVKSLLTGASGAAPPAATRNGHTNGTKPQTRQTDEGFSTVIGTDIYTGQDVVITQNARLQGVYGPGKSGVGKSVLFLNMLLQDIHHNRGVALVEPHGELTKNVLAGIPERRLKDVIYLDLSDSASGAIGLNLFQVDNPRDVTEVAKVASFVMHLFERVWNIGTHTPQLAQVVRNVTRACIEAGLTFAEIPLLLFDDGVRDTVIKQVKNPHTQLFWRAYNQRSPRDRAELTSSTTNKCDAYLNEPMISNILSQSKTTINFRTIMDERKILLVNLSPQLEEMSRLVGTLLIAKILMASFSRVDTPEEQRPQFNLYVDEFQRYQSSEFRVFIEEARKFRVSVTIAHQSLSQILDEDHRTAATGAGSIICFRVLGDDSKVFARSYDCTPSLEIVGQEPQRSPVADILTHLVRRGHDDPRVAKFGQTYLANLERFLNKPPEPYGPRYSAYYNCFDGQISLPEKHVVLAREWLNDTLYQAMIEKRSDLHIQTLSIYILAVAQGGCEFILSNWVTKSLGEFKAFKPGAEKFGKPSFTTPVTSEEYISQITKGWKKYVWMAEELVSMLKELRYVMGVLAKTPIMVDTGLYVPQYRQRTYQDQENLIANELSQLPNFHAKVRLLTGEHTIRTHPAPALLPESEVQKRITAIKNRMLLQGVTRPYREVEEEVRARHLALREQAALSDAPPPTHVNGNRRRRKPSPANT